MRRSFCKDEDVSDINLLIAALWCSSVVTLCLYITKDDVPLVQNGTNVSKALYNYMLSNTKVLEFFFAVYVIHVNCDPNLLKENERSYRLAIFFILRKLLLRL